VKIIQERGRTMDACGTLAFSATAHCLTGCAIGELLGLVIGTILGWSTLATIVLATVLAFYFGYSLTMLPLLRSGLALATVLPIAFAADTLSITVMEIVDNLIILVIPGAMEAGLGSLLFWGSLAFALAVAFVAAFPVNRYLIVRGRDTRWSTSTTAEGTSTTRRTLARHIEDWVRGPDPLAFIERSEQ
jgi:hypothetical protein